jgi:hypothetical protein
MKVETYECNICHKQKQRANRWWKVRMVNGAIVISPWDLPDDTNDIVASLLDAEDTAHLCGEECALKHISKKLFHPEAVSEPRAGRGPQTGSPAGVLDVTGSRS